MNSADHLVRRSTFLRFCLCVMAFVIGLIAGPATVSAAPFTEDFGTNTGDVASFNFQRSGVTFTMTYSPANGGGTLFWDGSVGEGGGPGILTSPTNQTGQMHTVTIARADGAGWVLTSIYLDTATSITATANLVGGGTSPRTATAAGTVSFGGVAVTSLVLTGTDFGYGVIDTLVGDTTDDTVAPTVASITATTANGTYKTGDTIQIAVTFSETVIVTGTPQLALNSGGTASYSSGSGTSTLNFNYTVQAGDAAFDLDYVATGSLVLNGGTIRAERRGADLAGARGGEFAGREPEHRHRRGRADGDERHGDDGERHLQDGRQHRRDRDVQRSGHRHRHAATDAGDGDDGPDAELCVGQRHHDADLAESSALCSFA